MNNAEAGVRFGYSGRWRRDTPYSFYISNVKFKRSSIQYASNGRKSAICSKQRISFTPLEFLNAQTLEFVCAEENPEKRDGEIRISFPLAI